MKNRHPYANLIQCFSVLHYTISKHQSLDSMEGHQKLMERHGIPQFNPRYAKGPSVEKLLNAMNETQLKMDRNLMHNKRFSVSIDENTHKHKSATSIMYRLAFCN